MHSKYRELHQDQPEIGVTAWEQGVLMPQNLNVPQVNALYSKNARAINRKQFLERRRNNEKQHKNQNSDSGVYINKQRQEQRPFEAMHRITRNGNLSSITQLKRQMENIERAKDRWEEDKYNEFREKGKYIHKGSLSGFIHTFEGSSSRGNLDITQAFHKQVSSYRENGKRPISSGRDSSYRSITLSERNNERSKTIHSRCSKRSLPRKQKPARSKCKSNKLNITINQIEGRKMRSILEILMDHQ